MSGNEEFIQEFLVECEENLDQLDQDLIALEENPRDPDRLASIFRTVHTIKGTSGFFGFAKLGAVTHVGENLLGRLRDGELVLDAEMTNALLRFADTVREILGSIEQQGAEGEGDYTSLVAQIEVLAAQPAVVRPEAEPDQTARGDQDLRDVPVQNQVESEPAEPDSKTPTAAEETLAAPAEPPGVQPADESPELVIGTGASAAAETSRSGQADSIEQPEEPVPDDEEAVQEQSRRDQFAEDDTEPVSKPAAAPSQGTVRVDVGLLNDLMNQVGELVLARNQIRPFADSNDDRGFSSALQHLDLITGDLQEGIMKTRLQPIGNLWARLPRVVRDLARVKAKDVQLELHGHDTELDRTLLEAIKDPLTHLVRNAVDHGIESPDARRRVGKPATGCVVLRAFHEGGLVNIEISDDGAGIDPDRVRDKALRQGLISREQAGQMSAHQITQLIFQPGLSTAEQVTDISGRGVGMDVVKTNIERIGGSVAIDSQPGTGTKLRVKIPLTLAIVPVLMVTSCGQRFAIPQVSLREIITLRDGATSIAIERVGDALVYRLRGELLPMIRLSSLLHLPATDQLPADDYPHVVVLQAVGQRFGLIVDQIARTEEIVVKPLHKTLAQIPVFSGATVLGDGRVALILDVAGLARTAGLEQPERAAVGQPSEAQEDADWEDASSEFGDYLICEAVPGRHVAIAFSDVSRLEEFASADVQISGGQGVIPYRDQLMPLLTPDGNALSRDWPRASVHVVVHEMGDRHVGLMMHRILDVAPAAQTVDTSQKRVGVRGRVLVDNQVHDVVDIEALAHSAGIRFPSEPASEVMP